MPFETLFSIFHLFQVVFSWTPVNIYLCRRLSNQIKNGPTSSGYSLSVRWNAGK